MNLIVWLKKYLFTLLVVAAILYLSLARTSAPDDMPQIPHADKIVHFIMYLGVMLAFYLDVYRQSLSQKSFRRRLVWGLFLCVVFGGVVELLQMYCTTYRTGDWWDWVADALGVLAGAWSGRYLVPFVSRFLPAFLFDKPQKM